MDKAFIKKILAVVLGIALIIMIFGTVSLFWDAIGIGDLKKLDHNLDAVESFMRWSAVGLALMMVPALTSYAFAFFSDKKFYKITAASLSLAVVLCCIIFISLCRHYAIDDGYVSTYASAAGYFSELMQILIASTLIGVYFLLITVLPAKKTEQVEATTVEAKTEEVKNEEN